MMVDKAENPNIPEYQLGTNSDIPKDSKDRDHFNKILDKKMSQESNNYDKKASSPKASSSLPRYVECYSIGRRGGGVKFIDI